MKDTTRQAIIELKRAKEQNDITCQKIFEICEKNGEAIGITTIRRVFAPGSEDKPNNIRPATINAILHAVLGMDETLTKAENAALGAVVEMNEQALAEKDETIRMLTRELEDARLQLEATKEVIRIAMEAFGTGSVR